MMLHMANDGILPVSKINRSVRTHIHRYRPKTEMGGASSFLDFSLPAIDRMMHQGYQDAMHHDCVVEQCVLPPDVPPVSGGMSV